MSCSEGLNLIFFCNSRSAHCRMLLQDFVVAVHARAAKATAEGKLSPRASIMLGLVLDIKNNKRKDKANGPAAVLSPTVVKWLKQSHVGQVQLKGLTWQKLLTKDKKVQS